MREPLPPVEAIEQEEAALAAQAGHATSSETEQVIVPERNFQGLNLEQTAVYLEGVVDNVSQTGTDEITALRRVGQMAREGGQYILLAAGCNVILRRPEWTPVLGTASVLSYLAAGTQLATKFMFGPGLSTVCTPLNTRINVLHSRTDIQGVHKGGVVLNVTPSTPQAGANKQTAANRQLAELRDVSANAEYDHIIVPAALTRAAQVRKHKPMQTRQDILEPVTGYGINDMTAVEIWTKKSFQTYARSIEYLDNDNRVIDTIVSQLLRYEPNPRIQLMTLQPGFVHHNSPRLRRYVTDILRKQAEKHVDQATRVRTGPTSFERQYLTTQVRHTHSATFIDQLNHKRRVLDIKPAAQLAGIKEPIGSPEFVEKLNQGGYSKLQLAYVGIRLLEKPQTVQHAAVQTQTVQHPIRFKSPAGRLGNEIKNPDLRRHERIHRWQRRIGTLLLASSLVTGFHFAKDHLPDMSAAASTSDSAPPRLGDTEGYIGRAIQSDETDWVMESHGLTTSGYYQDRFYDYFNGRYWDYKSTGEIVDFQNFPPDFQIHDQPHITAKHDFEGGVNDALYADGSRISLPTKAGTKIGAVRGFTKTGPVSMVAELTSRGQWLASPARDLSESLTLVKIEFDLVTDPAYNPNAAETEQGAFVQSMTDLTQRTFRYDNTEDLDKITDNANSIKDLLNNLEKAQICNCNLCSTYVTLQTQKYYIDTRYTTGYMNLSEDYSPASGKSQTALEAKERHAWVTLPDGTIFDPTPSVLSRAEEKARQHDEIKQPPEPLDGKDLLKIIGPLMGFMGLQLAVPGAIRRRKQQQKNWFNKASTREAYNFLSWVSFGQPHVAANYPKQGDTPADIENAAHMNLDSDAVRSYITNQPWRLEKAAGLNWRQRMAARKLARKATAIRA